LLLPFSSSLRFLLPILTIVADRLLIVFEKARCFRKLNTHNDENQQAAGQHLPPLSLPLDDLH
jgi:hypothetical protein